MSGIILKTAQKYCNLLIGSAQELAQQSAKIAMRHYDKIAMAPPNQTRVWQKEDNSPLTRADLEIDQLLYRRLAEIFSETPIEIVTEERAETHKVGLASGYFILVDPIDGTKEFINCRDEFTVNVALIKDGVAIAGWVSAPALSKLYIGSKTKGAFEIDLQTGRQKPISVRQPDNERLDIVASRSHLSEQTSAFIAVNRAGEIVNAGSSLKFCLLATGKADLYPRFSPTMEWDTAAGQAVLEAAGGIVETAKGEPLAYGKPGFRNPDFIARSTKTRYRLA